MSEAIKEIKELLALFKMERIVYVIISITAFVTLLFCAIFTLIKNQDNYPAILGLFGSTGGVGYTAGRLLKMWGDAVEYITKKS